MRTAFVGVFCDAPQAVCEERDEEELYARAHRGELKNVSGVDSPFDRPSDDYLTLDTAQRSVDESVAAVLQQLKSRGIGTLPRSLEPDPLQTAGKFICPVRAVVGPSPGDEWRREPGVSDERVPESVE